MSRVPRPLGLRRWYLASVFLTCLVGLWILANWQSLFIAPTVAIALLVAVILATIASAVRPSPGLARLIRLGLSLGIAWFLVTPLADLALSVSRTTEPRIFFFVITLAVGGAMTILLLTARATDGTR